MAEVFLKVLNMGIAADLLALAVLLSRALLRRAPRWTACALWGVLALRLCLPFTLESALSLIPSAETLSPDTVRYAVRPAIDSGVPLIDAAVNPALGEAFAADPHASVNPLYVAVYAAGAVWALGAAAMLLWAGASALRLRRHLRTAVKEAGGVYVSEFAPSPFVFGLARPRIYLPAELDARERELVTAHERAHIRRGDHLAKALGWLLLSLHWYDPLMWLCWALFCRDVELACDERVVKDLTPEGRADYAAALLKCSAPRRGFAPLAFGETGVRQRVKRALDYKRPAVWLGVLGALLCLLAAVFFLTDPPADAQGTASVSVRGGSFTLENGDGAQLTYENGETGGDMELFACLESVSAEGPGGLVLETRYSSRFVFRPGPGRAKLSVESDGWAQSVSAADIEYAVLDRDGGIELHSGGGAFEALINYPEDTRYSPLRLSGSCAGTLRIYRTEDGVAVEGLTDAMELTVSYASAELGIYGVQKASLGRHNGAVEILPEEFGGS